MEWNNNAVCQWIDRKVEEFRFPYTTVIVGIEGNREETLRIFEENDLLSYWFKRPDKDAVIYFIGSPMLEHAKVLVGLFKVLEGATYLRLYQGKEAIKALVKEDE